MTVLIDIVSDSAYYLLYIGSGHPLKVGRQNDLESIIMDLILRQGADVLIKDETGTQPVKITYVDR